MTAQALLTDDNKTTEVAYPQYDTVQSRHKDGHDHFNNVVDKLLQRLENIGISEVPKSFRRICLFAGSLSATFSQENLYRLLNLTNKGYRVQVLLFDPFSDVSQAFSTEEYVLNLANQDILRINEAVLKGRKNMPIETLYEFRHQLSSKVFLYQQLDRLKQHLQQNSEVTSRLEVRYTHVKTESPTFILGDRVLKGHFFYNNDPDYFPWICSLQESGQADDISAYFGLHFDKLWSGSHSLSPPTRNVFVGYDHDIGSLCRVEKSLSWHYLHPFTFKVDDWQTQHIANIVEQYQQYANGAVFIMSNPNGDGQARSNVVAEFGAWCQRSKSVEGMQQRLFSKTLLILQKGIALSNWNLDDLESEHDVIIVRFTRDSYGNPSSEDWAKVEQAIKKLKVRMYGE